MKVKSIAIIGAGLAGVTAARILASSGFAVTIFEKSGRCGGRMAVRDHNGILFDHGAPYFQALTAEFQAHVARWVAQGSAEPWSDGAYVGVPDMTAPVTRMVVDAAQPIHLVTNHTICNIDRGTGTGTMLSALEGPIHNPDGGFTAVISAIPAPQAHALLQDANVLFPDLTGVRYEPCWSLMIAFDAPIAKLASSADCQRHVFKVVDCTSAKPGRNRSPVCYVAHANATWSGAHLEMSQEEVLPLLLDAFRRDTGSSRLPHFAVAHRWRYALVKKPLGTSFVWDDQGYIGACGDWCLGASVEDAFRSGSALGRHVANMLCANRDAHRDGS